MLIPTFIAYTANKGCFISGCSTGRFRFAGLKEMVLAISINSFSSPLKGEVSRNIALRKQINTKRAKNKCLLFIDKLFCMLAELYLQKTIFLNYYIKKNKYKIIFYSPHHHQPLKIWYCRECGPFTKKVALRAYMGYTRKRIMTLCNIHI